MRIGRTLLVASLILDSVSGLAEDLSEAMNRSGLRSVIIVTSEAVDEHPVWSPKGDALAVNVDGRWNKILLGPVTLIRGEWRGGLPIGVPRPAPGMSPLDERTVRAWEKAGKYDLGRVETRDGTVAEMKPDDLSTEFVITKKGADPESLWKSALESCHGLGLSPDEKYVAYVCELNGVIVTKL